MADQKPSKSAKSRWSAAGPIWAVAILGIVVWALFQKGSAPTSSVPEKPADFSSMSRAEVATEGVLAFCGGFAETGLIDSIRSAAYFNRLEETTQSSADASQWRVPFHAGMIVSTTPLNISADTNANSNSAVACSLLADNIDAEEVLARLSADDFLGPPATSRPFDEGTTYIWPRADQELLEVQLHTSTDFIDGRFDLAIEFLMPRASAAPPL